MTWAWTVVALRAAWLLPDWVAKWQAVLRSGGVRGRELPDADVGVQRRERTRELGDRRDGGAPGRRSGARRRDDRELAAAEVRQREVGQDRDGADDGEGGIERLAAREIRDDDDP